MLQRRKSGGSVESVLCYPLVPVNPDLVSKQLYKICSFVRLFAFAILLKPCALLFVSPIISTNNRFTFRGSKVFIRVCFYFIDLHSRIGSLYQSLLLFYI